LSIEGEKGLFEELPGGIRPSHINLKRGKILLSQNRSSRSAI